MCRLGTGRDLKLKYTYFQILWRFVFATSCIQFFYIIYDSCCFLTEILQNFQIPIKKSLECSSFINQFSFVKFIRWTREYMQLLLSGINQDNDQPKLLDSPCLGNFVDLDLDKLLNKSARWHLPWEGNFRTFRLWLEVCRWRKRMKFL